MTDLKATYELFLSDAVTSLYLTDSAGATPAISRSLIAGPASSKVLHQGRTFALAAACQAGWCGVVRHHISEHHIL